MEKSEERSTLISASISSILCVAIIGSLRFLSEWFTSSQIKIVFAGYLCSWIFILTLTSISNIEVEVFGNHFQAKFIPEILFSMIVALASASFIHRVCVSAAILFSVLGLYMMNRLSGKYYKRLAPIEPSVVGNRRNVGKKHK